MRKVNLYFIVVFSTLCFASCGSPRILQATKEDSIHDVNIETLILNIKKYHGLTIQTKGVYERAFEVSGIFPAAPEVIDGKINYKVKSIPGIWIEFDLRYTPPDSIEKFRYKKSNILLTVQGTIDTTDTGHLGQYTATIKNARILVRD